MNKSLLVVSCLTFFSFGATAQNGYLANPEFDDWGQVNHYEYPNHYSGSNFNGHSVANVTKSSDSQNGNYSLRVETIATSFGPYIAYFLNGTTTQGVVFNGGAPFSTVVDGISGYYKSDIAANDSAAIIVILKNSGAVVSQDIHYIKGTQSTWTQFNFPINSGAVTPDTIVWGAVSTDPFSGAEGIVGSWLMLDNISFTASGSVDPVPNLDFEDWVYHSTSEPIDWYSTNKFTNPLENSVSNLPCQEIMPGVNGTGSAVMVKTVTNSQGDTLPGILSYGEIELDDYSMIFHGKNYIGSPTKLSGYYHKPTAGDDGEMMVELFENGVSIFNGAQTISNATGSFTYFEVMLTYSGTPDSVKLMAFSGDNPGTELHLDSINFSGGNLLLPEYLFDASVKIYPNPSSDFIIIQSADNLLAAEIYTIEGKLVQRYDLNSSKDHKIDVNRIKKGNYILRIQNAKGMHSRQIMIE